VRLLLDTHTLLWLAHEPRKLSARAVAAIYDSDNEVLVSAVSAMEIATKVRNGKLEYRTSLATDFMAEIESQGFEPLAITVGHAQRAGNLQGSHRDPWDRLLVAQAQVEDISLVSSDARLADWPVELLW